MSLARLLAPIVALFVIRAAFAGQTCVSASIPLTTTNWTQTVSIPRFDSSLGVLTAVHVQLGAHLEGFARLEHFESVAISAHLRFSALTTVARPDNTVVVTAHPAQEFWPALAPYDGTFDFAGPSGISYMGLAVDVIPSPSVTLTSAADLALFTGRTSNPGTVALNVFAVGTSLATGAGPLIPQFSTQAAAVVTVCYDYGPAVTSYCLGTNASCPCANGGFNVSGCRNSGIVGATLVPSGVASLLADTLVLNSTSMPAGTSALFFQGTTRVNGGAGTFFGDGLLCAGGTVTRLAIKTAASTSAQYPVSGDAPISVAGGVSAGAVLTYQTWYRDAATFCTSNTFNLTQGLEVIWVQ